MYSRGIGEQEEERTKKHNTKILKKCRKIEFFYFFYIIFKKFLYLYRTKIKFPVNGKYTSLKEHTL